MIRSVALERLRVIPGRKERPTLEQPPNVAPVGRYGGAMASNEPKQEPEGGETNEVAAEFLIEPFVEGEPGAHVAAAIQAFEAQGLAVDVGPFATVSVGDLDGVANAVAETVRNSMAAGATSLRIHVSPNLGDLAVAPLHDALSSMVRAVERDFGSPRVDWTRAEKQAAVRLLDEQGAFLLRGAVDDIAKIMGVSRITIYNYLNAIDRRS